MDLHEKIADLQQKLDAVVAELALLKTDPDHISILTDNTLKYMMNVDNHTPGEFLMAQELLYRKSIKTPNADSILNSLRAEGVEMIADAIGQKCSELKVGSKEWKSLKSIVFTLISFSSQLRSGDADKEAK